jgi:hypothetical protein
MKSNDKRLKTFSRLGTIPQEWKCATVVKYSSYFTYRGTGQPITKWIP